MARRKWGVRNSGRDRRDGSRRDCWWAYGTLLAVPLVLLAEECLANPKGGVVAGGQATITQAPGQTVVDQKSQRAILNWQSFSIGAREATRFNQPNSDAIALNRVVGNNPSEILGRLQANGNVWLINRNGILFGPSAQVNVHGLMATTADIRDEDFLFGRYDFSIPSPNATASVVNQGQISLGEHGLGALVAPYVRNDGTIEGRLGQVVLAGTPTFTLDFRGNGLIDFAVTGEVAERLVSAGALVENEGTITVDGGRVLLTGDAAAGLIDNVINMDGYIAARSVSSQAGAIVLQGDQESVVRVAGTLDASGRDSGERGGEVKVLGDKVGLFDGATVDVAGDAGGGTALIGGNFQGKGPERNASLTYVAERANISADALSTGDGGKVIVWADTATRFDGAISARGGAEGGNGGFVEVSGKSQLAFNGHVDVGAPAGQNGSVLLDPDNIQIVDTQPVGFLDANTFDFDTGCVNSKCINFDDFINIVDGGSERQFWITPATLAALVGNITLQATVDITVGSPVSLTKGPAETFTLQAGNNININANITTTGGNIRLEADSGFPGFPTNGVGDVRINAPISAGSGTLSLSGANINVSQNMTTSGPILANTGGTFQNTAPITSTGGLVSINALNGVTIGGAISGVSEEGLNGVNISGFPGNLSVTSPITATQGDISLSAGNFSNTGSVSARRGNVTIFADDFDIGNIISAATDPGSTGNVALRAQRGLVFSSAPVPGVAVLSATDLTFIDTPELVITASGIEFRSPTDFRASRRQRVILGSTENITQAPGASILADALGIEIGRFVDTGIPVNVVLTDPGNSVGVFALGALDDTSQPTVGDVALTNAGSLAIGEVNPTGITARSVTLNVAGELTLDAPIVATGGGDSVVLITGVQFINNAGPTAINPGAGRFLVYSIDPRNDDDETLIAREQKRYGRTFVPGESPANLSADPATAIGNLFLYQVQPVLVLAADDVTRRQFDNNPALTFSVSGLIDGDSRTDAASGEPVLFIVPAVGANSNAPGGLYTIVMGQGDLSLSALGYQLALVNGGLTVIPTTPQPPKEPPEADGRGVAAPAFAMPQPPPLTIPPSEQPSAHTDLLYSNDGNRETWGLAATLPQVLPPCPVTPEGPVAEPLCRMPE